METFFWNACIVLIPSDVPQQEDEKSNKDIWEGVCCQLPTKEDGGEKYPDPWKTQPLGEEVNKLFIFKKFVQL